MPFGVRLVSLVRPYRMVLLLGQEGQWHEHGVVVFFFERRHTESTTQLLSFLMQYLRFDRLVAGQNCSIFW